METFYKYYRRQLCLLMLLLTTFGTAWAYDGTTWDNVSYIGSRSIAMSDHGSYYEILIYSPEDLATYARRVTDYKDNEVEREKYLKAHLHIMANLDMDAHIWVAIAEHTGGGDESNGWKGELDGHGHTIKNLHIKECGNKHSGLFDRITGNAKVMNVTFENCDDKNEQSRTAIIVGGLYKNSDLTVENVTFKNCNVRHGNSMGLIVGFGNKASVTMNNISIIDSECYNEDREVGLCLGKMESCTINAQNIKVTHSSAISKHYVGGIVGYLEGDCNANIEDVNIVLYQLYGEEFCGGVVGQWEGKGHIYNSYVKIDFPRKVSESKNKDYGGLVGKFRKSNTSVSLVNSVVDATSRTFFCTEGDQMIGGAVGYTGEYASCNMKNIAVLSDHGYNTMPLYHQGLLFGGCQSNAHVSVSQSVVDDWYSSTDLYRKCWGTECVDYSCISGRDNIYQYCTIDKTAKRLYYLARCNELGFMLAPDYYPVNNKDSIVVRFSQPSQNKIKEAKYNNNKDIIYNNEYIMGVTGQPLEYSYEVDADKWIVEDISTGLDNVTRTGENSFKSTVQTDFSGSRKLQCRVTKRPNVSMLLGQFNPNRQCVELKWTVTNESELGKYWNNATWRVYRDDYDGKQNLVAEDLPYNTREFVDEDAPLDKKCQYIVKLIEKNLQFYGKHTGNTVVELMCDANVKLRATLDSKKDKATITTQMPNSKNFQGCTLTLYRCTYEDWLQMGENVDKLITDDKYIITSTQYTGHLNDVNNFIGVGLDDVSKESPCTMYYYYVKCDNFTEGYYKEHNKVLVSNVTHLFPNSTVQLSSFNAAKGESAEKVRIEWKSVFTGQPVDVHYVLSRKKYNPDDAGKSEEEDTEGWQSIYETTNSFSSNSFTDETLPGYVYKYRVRAIRGCDGVINDATFDHQKFDIGYTASRGTIMGKVNFYNTGTSVEGVDVRLSPDSLSMSNKGSMAYARYFAGDTDLMYLAPGMGRNFWNGDWTLQFLLRPLANTAETSVANIADMLKLTLRDSTLICNGTPVNINPLDYNRIMIRRQNGTVQVGLANTPKDTGGQYFTPLFEERIQPLQTFCDSILFGMCGGKQSFNGMLDEVRLWNKALDEAEVRRTYDRYLTGNESDLAAYYTFDSGVAEYAFDESHPDGIWNKRHTKIQVLHNEQVKPALRSDICPSTDILCYRGSSDRNGEYQIAGIPFTGEGTNYMVVPIYGTHEFTPASTRRYVSGQSLTHNAVDFKDVSSFPVDIQVYYAHGTYPAEGINVFVDGNAAVGKDGKNVITDVNGKCTVSVPVGSHRLTVGAINHTMVNDGYPCSITEVNSNGTVEFEALQDENGLIDFQSSPVAPLVFYDKSVARVVGRVVGGNAEGDKPLGAGYSRANIGRTCITLEPSVRSGHEINSHNSDIQIAPAAVAGEAYKDSINSTTTYVHNSSDIKITTDSVTGEFLALVPPIDMRIKDIHTVGTNGGQLLWKDFNQGNQSDLVTINMLEEMFEDIRTDAHGKLLPEDKMRKLLYNARVNYTYYVEPEILVENVHGNGEANAKMWGDSLRIMSYVDAQDSVRQEKVWLWNPQLRDGSPKSYMLGGLPVFSQGTKYNLNISLFDRYHNYDTGKDSLYYIPNVELDIKNEFDSKKATIKHTPQVGESYSTFQYAVDTDSVAKQIAGSPNGKVNYEFTAGFPNPEAPHTLGFSIKYTTNGKTYVYPEEGSIRGIVTGHVDIPGTDMVTQGPNVVSFVLRDPPGSGSSSYIEKGTTISSSASVDDSGTGSGTWSNAMYRRKKDQVIDMTTVATEAPFGKIKIKDGQESEALSDQIISLSCTGGDKQTTVMTYTTNERLSTSSSPTYTGSDGDLYVGCATNITFSQSRNIDLKLNTSGSLAGQKNHYELEQYDAPSKYLGFKTVFRYSQYHILNVLIPEYRKLRRSYVTEVVKDLNAVPQVASDSRARFYVKEGVSDKKDKWDSGVDYIYVPAKGAKATADSILLICSHIDTWKQVIRNNERSKIEAMKVKSLADYNETIHVSNISNTIQHKYGFLGNTSFDAGASQSFSMTRETAKTQNNHVNINLMENVVFQCKVKGEAPEVGADLGNLGDKMKFDFKGGYTRVIDHNKTTTDKQSFGYTLADSNPGSSFSVDVWLPGRMTELAEISGVKPDTTKTNKDSLVFRPSFGEFFVFRLRGGQSMHPWQGPEYTKVYTDNNKSVLLNEGTIAIEEPKIKLEQHTFTDVPNGQSLKFPITIGNVSTAISAISTTFNFLVPAGSNPDGLQFYIDGVAIPEGSGYQVRLKAGESVTKTLEVKQTRTDVIHYNNLLLRLVCDGEKSRFDTDTISVHFKPASSPITLKQGNNIINNSTPNKAVSLTVSDYQPDFENFTGVRIQYRTPNELTWHLATVLANDSAKLAEQIGVENLPNPLIKLDRKELLTRFAIPMDKMADGEYLFRAQSFSTVGRTSEVTTESEILSVLKDTSAPALMGNPGPYMGYYTGNEEISIEMNESIDMALLTDSNFVVTGVLNDAEVRHTTGLHFDGATPAHTQSRVNIFGNSSTLAFWYKPQVGKRSCLISQQAIGADGNEVPLALYYNADATMTLKLGDDVYNSTRKAVQILDDHQIAINDWMYASLHIDRESSTIRLYNLFGTSTQNESEFLVLDNASAASLNCNVPLYIGGSAQAEECYADVDNMVLYKGNQVFATVAGYKDQLHNDHMNLLLGYWPMDEGDGTMAKDKVRGRNIVLDGTDHWYMPVTNYALNLDGKSYLSIHTDNCPISKDQDYVLEFSFRTGENRLQTIFSNGSGKADSGEQNITERLSIQLDADGCVLLNAAGHTYKYDGKYNDDNWHHASLNVQRSGYARLSVDGEELVGTVSIPGTLLGGFSNARMTLGAMAYNDSVGVQHLDSATIFAGRLDEVRIWNAHRTQQIVWGQMSSHRLGGDEPGLVAYYPFEESHIVSNQPVTKPTLSDRVVANADLGITVATDPDVIGDAKTQENGPRIKSGGIEQPISVEYTHNGSNRIVLRFKDNLDKRRIEDCSLMFTVRNLKDLAGNTMSQPVTWNVFVDQSSLTATIAEPALVQEIGKSQSTTLVIRSYVAKSERWVLSNLPEWLSASQMAGILEPFGVTFVTLTTSTAAAIGQYEANICVTGEDNLAATTPVALSVVSIRPDWQLAETDGGTWMSLLGRAKIDGKWAINENDMVGAFTADGRCLAISQPEYDESMNAYFLHMNITGNTADNGKELSFMVWDAETGVTYTSTEISYWLADSICKTLSLKLQNCKVLGDFTHPYIISTRDVICQNISLHKGWNWISLWVDPVDGYLASSVLAPAMEYITEVKERTTGYKPNTLDELSMNLAQAYLIHANEDVTFAVEGSRINPEDVDVTFRHPAKPGTTSWQWLGYPLGKTLTLTSAFADLEPAVNDVVKSQRGYAMYNGHTWVGNLKYLSPGEGYMYGFHASDTVDVTWTYPARVKDAGCGYALDVDPYAYENYTYAQIDIEGVEGKLTPRFQVAAFTADGRCHGVSAWTDGGLCINIYGSEEDVYTFRLCNVETGQVAPLLGEYAFDAMTPEQCIKLAVDAPDAINSLFADKHDDWYNLQGIRLHDAPQGRGVYINNRSKKQKR